VVVFRDQRVEMDSGRPFPRTLEGGGRFHVLSAPLLLSTVDCGTERKQIGGRQKDSSMSAHRIIDRKQRATIVGRGIERR
jgi:hypothetical protein